MGRAPQKKKKRARRVNADRSSEESARKESVFGEGKKWERDKERGGRLRWPQTSIKPLEVDEANEKKGVQRAMETSSSGGKLKG